MAPTIHSYPLSPVQHKNTHNSHSAIKLVVPLLVLTAGTGGVLTAKSAAELNRWVYNPHIHIEPSQTKHIDTRSPADHVDNIRSVFAVNMSDLASILGVTRPTVYAWLAGQEPKEETVIRIQQLSRAADKFNQANIIRLDKLIHRPILNGRSLLDILKANEDPMAILPTVKAISDKEAQTRSESKGSGKHLRSLDDVLSESSVSIHERS